MKSLIALVVAIGLVSVQGTSIIRHVMSKDLGITKDHDHMTIDGRNAMLTGLIRNKLRNIGRLENVFLEKKEEPSIECNNSTCKYCENKFCLLVIYDSKSDSFNATITLFGAHLFQKTIHVSQLTSCEHIEKTLFKGDVCMTIGNVKIMNGRVCANIKFELGHLFSRTILKCI